MEKKPKNKTKKQLEVIRRKEIAVDLRTSGYTYRDIYLAMKEMAHNDGLVLPESYDQRYVYRDVKTSIEEAQKNVVESAEMLRSMELHNLNRMQSAIIEKAASGNLKAIDSVIKIMNQRAKYISNLSEPQKIEVRGWQQEVIDLIKEGKITIEHLRELPPELKLGQEIMAQLPESTSEAGDGIGSDAVEGEYVDLGQVDAEVSGETHSE